jgi:hypothetical protein
MLGIVATMAYSAPLMMSLNEASASGGKNGFFGGGGSGGGYGGGKPRGFGSGSGGFIINDSVTVKECSDCHQAYGGDALPQGAWRRIMGNLQDHFGENASLDEPTRVHIENYLMSNAIPGDGPMRITEQAWFVGEHRGEVSSWGMQRAKSLANCDACHGGNRRNGGQQNGGWMGR